MMAKMRYRADIEFEMKGMFVFVFVYTRREDITKEFTKRQN